MKTIINALSFLFRFLDFLVLWLLLILTTAWGFGVFWFDLPIGGARHFVAFLYLLAVIGLLFFVKPQWRGKLLVFAIFGIVVCWWLTLRPSNARNWQESVACEPWAEVKGDLVTLHNVRNFDYQKGHPLTPRWEVRTVDLSKLTGIDLAINYWGSAWIAHLLLSFQFSNSAPIVMSIETRREKGETYSPLGGLFRQFELVYIAADERDVFRVRTQNKEDVYLYHTTQSPEEARDRFLEYIHSINELHSQARWYNAITANCTTAISSQRSDGHQTPLDGRMLLNGKIDEMLFEKGYLETDGLSFPELKKRAKINIDAKAADQSVDFSKMIREGRPGFETPY